MAGEKYTNIGKARWENANVGVIRWDPENKAGLASVIDETTGTVYEIGGGDFSTATVKLNFTYPSEGDYISSLDDCAIAYPNGIDPNFGFVNNYGCTNISTSGDEVELLLYNGVGYFATISGKDASGNNFYIGTNTNISGNVEAVQIGSDSWYKVTGDCTITATMELS